MALAWTCWTPRRKCTRIHQVVAVRVRYWRLIVAERVQVVDVKLFTASIHRHLPGTSSYAPVDAGELSEHVFAGHLRRQGSYIRNRELASTYLGFLEFSFCNNSNLHQQASSTAVNSTTSIVFGTSARVMHEAEAEPACIENFTQSRRGNPLKTGTWS